MKSSHFLLVALLGLSLVATGCGIFGGSGNGPPSITEIEVQPSVPTPGIQATLTADVTDPDGDSLSYQWSGTAGSFQGESATENPATWMTPSENGTYEITCTVDDGTESVSETITVDVGRQRN